ncbi:MAG TPA: P-loop NTPase fold protein [Candidatus Binatia bacterium]|nr:P-loop NTPase fold protein [Candidatus Binatia bacterium]
MAGVALVAFADLSRQLEVDGYRATAFEWLFYWGGSLLVIACRHGLVMDRSGFMSVIAPRPDNCSAMLNGDLPSIQWRDIEEWLASDKAAVHDLFDVRPQAEQVIRLIRGGTRSVGIVGSFGIGKTTFLNWVENSLLDKRAGGPRYLFCRHSCWGFETSSVAIREMLTAAVSEVRRYVDTFQVESLPDSYRRTFFGSNELAEAAFDVLAPLAEPTQQFHRLSELLTTIDARMVLVVEDVDRNETRNFELHEVLAFFERIKHEDLPNIILIVAGGLSATLRIDYAKLCDHIELLRSTSPTHALALLSRVRDRCLDTSVFPHAKLAKLEDKHDWDPRLAAMAQGYSPLPFAYAALALLNTPRLLRHALSRTLHAWRSLHGEIDLDHLLTCNILRLSAPEAFDFLIRRWAQIRQPPSGSSTWSRQVLENVQAAVRNDWAASTMNVEWNVRAAIELLKYILPSSVEWLTDEPRVGAPTVAQGIAGERYWVRAINCELRDGEIRDQDVVRDIDDWFETRDQDAKLVRMVTDSEAYGETWGELAALRRFPRNILDFGSQVIAKILGSGGADASYHSLGFVPVYRFIVRNAVDEDSRVDWLLERIREAAPLSVAMVSSLVHFYTSDDSFFVPRDDRPGLKLRIVEAFHSRVPNAAALRRAMSIGQPYALSQLVMDTHKLVPATSGHRTQAWEWIGPLLLENLRAGDATIAIAVSSLLALRDPHDSRIQPIAADEISVASLFSADSVEVGQLLDCLVEQCPTDDHQDLVRRISASLADMHPVSV